MLVVAALGGNALLRRGERADAETQRRNVAIAADALADIATEHRLVVTHGYGPQVGLLALQAQAYTHVRPLADAPAILAGRAGTRAVPESSRPIERRRLRRALRRPV